MMALAVARRIGRLGIASLLVRDIPREAQVVYLDAGLHKDARQLRLVSGWFAPRCRFRAVGFEAHPDYARLAEISLAGLADVTVENIAVVGPGQPATMSLNLDGTTGLGDSLIRKRTGASIEVPAKRLTHYLAEAGIDPKRDIILLRMNIEGAELFVLEDILEAGLTEAIDGYYGTWNDPEKIGGETARQFDAILEKTGIRNFRFNDPDCNYESRKALVRYDMVTSILAGGRKKRAVDVRT